MANGPDPLMYFAPFPIYNLSCWQIVALKPAACTLPVGLKDSYFFLYLKWKISDNDYYLWKQKLASSLQSVYINTNQTSSGCMPERQWQFCCCVFFLLIHQRDKAKRLKKRVSCVSTRHLPSSLSDCCCPLFLLFNLDGGDAPNLLHRNFNLAEGEVCIATHWTQRASILEEEVKKKSAVTMVMACIASSLIIEHLETGVAPIT